MRTRIEFLTCKKCHVEDRNRPSPSFHVGTSKSMVCPDCADGRTNLYGQLLASLCRDCCPTGHGTHERRSGE